MNYAQWLTEWLEVYEKPSIKPKTYSRYAQIIKHHIIGNLGKYRIHELTPSVLQQYTLQLMQSGNLRTSSGLCPNSVNAILTVIKSSLKTAYEVGKVRQSPCEKIRRPKACENRITCFTLAEQKAIEEEILSKKELRLYGVIVCLYTGLRLGELLALEKTDLDLAGRTISITKSCHDGIDESGKFKRITDTPKTANSNRVIPIPRQILPVVEKMIESSPTQHLIGFLKDKPVAVRSYQRSFERLLKRLKIEHKGFHSLRHTFATRALECGMDVKTLAEILGHKNPNITLKHYAHSLTEHKNAMMNRLGELFLD